MKNKVCALLTALCLNSLIWAQPDNQIIQIPFFNATPEKALAIHDGWLLAVETGLATSSEFNQIKLIRIKHSGEIVWERQVTEQRSNVNASILLGISGNKVLMVTDANNCNSYTYPAEMSLWDYDGNILWTTQLINPEDNSPIFYVEDIIESTKDNSVWTTGVSGEFARLQYDLEDGHLIYFDGTGTSYNKIEYHTTDADLLVWADNKKIDIYKGAALHKTVNIPTNLNVSGARITELFTVPERHELFFVFNYKLYSLDSNYTIQKININASEFYDIETFSVNGGFGIKYGFSRKMRFFNPDFTPMNSLIIEPSFQALDFNIDQNQQIWALGVGQTYLSMENFVRLSKVTDNVMSINNTLNIRLARVFYDQESSFYTPSDTSWNISPTDPLVLYAAKLSNVKAVVVNLSNEVIHSFNINAFINEQVVLVGCSPLPEISLTINNINLVPNDSITIDLGDLVIDNYSRYFFSWISKPNGKIDIDNSNNVKAVSLPEKLIPDAVSAPVFPNPALDDLFIPLPYDDLVGARCRVYHLSGQLILDEVAPAIGSYAVLNIERLTTGMYILRVNDQSHKFYKQ